MCLYFLSGVRFTNLSLPQLPGLEFWHHVCVAVNLGTSRLSIVLGGQVLEDRVFTELQGAEDSVMGDLSGRLLLGKLYQGFWYQTRQRVTNMQLWAKTQDTASMMSITSGRATKSTYPKLIYIYCSRRRGMWQGSWGSSAVEGHGMEASGRQGQGSHIFRLLAGHCSLEKYHHGGGVWAGGRHPGADSGHDSGR